MREEVVSSQRSLPVQRVRSNADRRFRFLRALALISSTGCGGEADTSTPSDTSTPEDSSTLADTTHDSDVVSADTNLPDEGDSGVNCRAELPKSTSLHCAPGEICVRTTPSDGPVCATTDVGPSEPCLSIRCAGLCYCTGPTIHMCLCAPGLPGPLPPPELAAVFG